jgi:hypothetical protein
VTASSDGKPRIYGAFPRSGGYRHKHLTSPARPPPAATHRSRSDEARALLAKARELNPHIPAHLTGRKALPRRRPHHMRLGEESEAIDYAAGTRELWANTPGALAWLES